MHRTSFRPRIASGYKTGGDQARSVPGSSPLRSPEAAAASRLALRIGMLFRWFWSEALLPQRPTGAAQLQSMSLQARDGATKKPEAKASRILFKPVHGPCHAKSDATIQAFLPAPYRCGACQCCTRQELEKVIPEPTAKLLCCARNMDLQSEAYWCPKY